MVAFSDITIRDETVVWVEVMVVRYRQQLGNTLSTLTQNRYQR